MSEASEIKVEGAREKEDDLRSRETRQKELEQASQMDNIVPRVIDEVQYSRDLEEKEDHEKTLTKAEQLVKKPISNRKQAQLKEAREALRVKREKDKLEGRQGKQGTPVPDLLTDITKLMDSKFEQMLKTMQDIPRVLPAQDPLQEQLEARTKTVKRMDPVDPTLTHIQTPHDTQGNYPLHKSETVESYAPIHKRKYQDTITKQATNTAQRLRNSLQSQDIYNDQVRKRLETDPSLGKSSTSKSVFF